MSEPQNYSNHRTFDRALYGIAFLALCSAGLGLAALAGLALPAAIAPPALAVGVIWMLFRMRAYATRLQDRIIRLETQLRLERVLPAELRSRIEELELHHLIALRFASDAELPELVQQVLNDKSVSGDDIKRRIRNWKADHLRV